MEKNNRIVSNKFAWTWKVKEEYVKMYLEPQQEILDEYCNIKNKWGRV